MSRDLLINALLVLSDDQVLYEDLPQEVRDVCRQAAEALQVPGGGEAAPTVAPEQHFSERLERAKELLRFLQPKLTDIRSQLAVHNFLTGGEYVGEPVRCDVCGYMLPDAKFRCPQANCPNAGGISSPMEKR